MSRLYIKTKTDIGKGSGKRGSEQVEVEVYWGSANDSKLAFQGIVTYLKGSDNPVVYIKKGDVFFQVAKEDK